MTKEYLDSLKKLLNDNHYSDTDNIMEYYSELIEDRKETGEKEEDIINSLGSVEDIAKDLLGEVKVNIEDNDYSSGDIKAIKAQLISCDLIIDVNESLSEVSIDYPKDERIKLEQLNDTLSIREFKKNAASYEDNYQIVISFPSNYQLDKVDIEGSSCDLDIGGYSNIKIDDLTLYTASGDIDASGIEGKDGKVSTVSGDINLKELKFEKLESNSVSGDHQLEDVSADKIKINSVSGDIQANNVETIKLDSNSVSGDIEVKRCIIDDLYCETISGDINTNINGNKEDYTIELKGVFKIHSEGNGDKSIALKTKTGDTDYSFN